MMWHERENDSLPFVSKAGGVEGYPGKLGNEVQPTSKSYQRNDGVSSTLVDDPGESENPKYAQTGRDGLKSRLALDLPIRRFCLNGGLTYRVVVHLHGRVLRN